MLEGFSEDQAFILDGAASHPNDLVNVLVGEKSSLVNEYHFHIDMVSK